MKRLAGLIAALMFAAPAAAGAAWQIETPAPVQSIQVSGDDVFVRTVAGSVFRLLPCQDKSICLEATAAMPAAEAPPVGGLADGGVARADSGDILRAWYTHPTGRYPNGILGDTIEAGGLKVVTREGRELEFVLPGTHVFEDLTPRVVDLDGDGSNEVVTIRTSVLRGAAVAVYGLRDGELQLLDAVPEIGSSGRWLNIAGIAPYFGSRLPLIVWVESPSTAGILRMARLREGRLQTLPEEKSGFSNHVAGSRELGLSATHDFDGDGVADLVLPLTDRRRLIVMTARGSKIIDLPGPLSQRIAVVSGVMVSATENGNLLAIVTDPSRIQRP